jgi:hypothetical protein
MSYEHALRRQYPDIKIVHGLPKSLPHRSDNCSVYPGYIASVGGHGQEFALFFVNLEPALAFVQASRTSIDATGVDLLKALDVRNYDPVKRVDVRTIYIGPWLTHLRGCKPLLSRWVDGVRPGSSHWQSPDGRTLSEAEVEQIVEEWSAAVDAQCGARRAG